MLTNTITYLPKTQNEACIRFFPMNNIYILCIFVFVAFPLCCQSFRSHLRIIHRYLAKSPRLQRYIHHYHLLSSASTSWWAKEDLNFKCTGCGKCCSNKGEVWLDQDEFVQLTLAMNITAERFLDDYASEIKMDWIKLKEKRVNEDIGCIFLGDDSRTCSIYQHRPVHCRTYPYWTSLLMNRSSWEAEIVLPSDREGKHWTPENGGCEGISLARSEDGDNRIPSNTIYQNLKLDELYVESFPFLDSGDDRNRLLAKAGIMSKVLRSTRQWVKDFVIKYKLCPFADTVFKDETIRYRAYLGSAESKIIQKVKYEILTLLTSKESDISTTLLVVPFAFPDFQDFYDFSLRLEDEVLPLLQRQCNLPTTNKQENDVQLAFFHNGFQWGDTDDDAPINFEKRSPFPTINLLRAARIREYSTLKTKVVGENNKATLVRTGYVQLSEELGNLIKLAL